MKEYHLTENEDFNRIFNETNECVGKIHEIAKNYKNNKEEEEALIGLCLKLKAGYYLLNQMLEKYTPKIRNTAKIWPNEDE